VDRALEIAARLRPHSYRRDTILTLARTLAAAGDLDRALAIAAAQRPRVRDDILRAVARVTPPATAIAVAYGIGDAGTRCAAMIELSTSLAITGAVDTALAAVTALRDTHWDRGDMMLNHIATITADRGDLRTALRIAAGIEDAYSRMSVWTHTAWWLPAAELPAMADLFLPLPGRGH
jgi:hypothetical protein